MIVAVLILAQLMTPPPSAFPPPVSVSERTIFDRGLGAAQNAAQALGGLLGAAIEDLSTGVGADTNGDQPLVLAGMERLPLEIRAIDPHARMDGIDLEPGGVAFASPNAFARILSGLYTDSLVDAAHSNELLASLDTPSFASRLRAGIPPHAQLQHIAGTLETPDVAQAVNDAGIVHIPGHVLLVVAMLHDAGGTQAQRDAVLAQVARAAVDGATATP